MHSVWVFITDCGDSAVTLPLALLVLIFLFVANERRLGYAWIATIGGCASAIGMLKLVFGACGENIADGLIVSPSGHTAMSTAVYGSLAALAGSRLPARQRAVVYAAATAGIVGIALSRVVLHEHNFPEIVIGWLVGAVGVASFAAILGRREAPALPFGWMLVCGVVLVAILHGTRWQIEPVLHHFARIFRLALPYCR
ncbi:MAG TPA: phosphatase PAP2 family protein [Stellaceae bacterium]|nr:phosphatase PAP2 family protein [Stellaceae bacterium]